MGSFSQNSKLPEKNMRPIGKCRNFFSLTNMLKNKATAKWMANRIIVLSFRAGVEDPLEQDPPPEKWSGVQRQVI